MKEILPGIYHWTAFHKGIGFDVSSYFVVASATLIDPMMPPDGLRAFADVGEPERIVLTCRHHYRGSDRFVEAFGCPVLCPEPGLHEFEDGPDVQGYAWGEEVARDHGARGRLAVTRRRRAPDPGGRGAGVR